MGCPICNVGIPPFEAIEDPAPTHNAHSINTTPSSEQASPRDPAGKLADMAAENLLNFYWANVYKDPGNCPTLEAFIDVVHTEALVLQALRKRVTP